MKHALAEARRETRTTVIVIETDPEPRVGGYESWWDVPPAEVSTMDKARAARQAYEETLKRESWLV